MPQPNQGKPAPGAPTAAPVQGPSGSGANASSIHFGAPGGKGTKGSGKGTH